MIVGERPIAFRKAIPQRGGSTRLLEDSRSALPLPGQEIGEERLHDSGEIAGNAFNLLNEILAQREIDRTLTCRTGGATHHSDILGTTNAHCMRIGQRPQRQARQLSPIRPHRRYAEIRIVASRATVGRLRMLRPPARLWLQAIKALKGALIPSPF